MAQTPPVAPQLHENTGVPFYSVSLQRNGRQGQVLWPTADAPHSGHPLRPARLTTVPSFPPQLNFDLTGCALQVIQAVVDEGDGEWHLPSTPLQAQGPSYLYPSAGVRSRESAHVAQQAEGSRPPSGRGRCRPRPRVDPRADRPAVLASTPRGSGEGCQPRPRQPPPSAASHGVPRRGVGSTCRL